MPTTDPIAAILSGDFDEIARWLDAQDVGSLDRRYTIRKLTLLMVASRSGELAIAEKLLAAGADPNAVNDNSETPLMLAAGGRHHRLVEGRR
jgi:hypothetical protein